MTHTAPAPGPRPFLPRAAAAFALLVAAAAAASSAHARDLAIGFADPVSSADPQLNNHAGDRSLALHFWDSLVELRDGNHVVPALASSWKNVDPKTWSFALNPDIRWQDGRPLTADDVVFSLQRARDVPGSVASYRGSLRTIAAVEAPDAHTIVIRTSVPNPNLLIDISSIYVVSRHAGDGARTEDYNSGKAMIGTGPYRFVSYAPGDRTEMQVYDGYHRGRPEWDRVSFRYIANGAARTAALLSGDVDIIDKVAVTDVGRLKTNPAVSVFEYPGLRALLVQPSFRAGPSEFITDGAGRPLPENPLRDRRVREALNVAINRDAIADRILQGTVTVANQWMPKDSFGFNPDVPAIAPDAQKARKLLAEAGFAEGFQITVHVPGDRYPQAPEAMQAVAQFWTRIGVRTKLEVVPWAVYAARAGRNEYAVSVIAWGNGTGEAGYGLLQTLATNDAAAGRGINNWGRYSNADVDRDLDAATTEFDDGRRAAIFRHAAKLVTDDVAQFPLFHYKNLWATKKGLKVVPLLSDRTSAMQVSGSAPAAR